MERFARIDVSSDQSSVCMVDATGEVVRDAKVVSKPAALARFFADLGCPVVRIRLEAGPKCRLELSLLAPAVYNLRKLHLEFVRRAQNGGNGKEKGRKAGEEAA